MSDVAQRIAPSAEHLLNRALLEALASGKNAIEVEHVVMALASQARAEHKALCGAFDLLREHFGGSS